VVHSRNRPFKCATCGKGFSQKSHVRTHQTVHTGVKAFTCSICDKKFSQLGHLNGHVERHKRLGHPTVHAAMGLGVAPSTKLTIITKHTGGMPPQPGLIHAPIEHQQQHAPRASQINADLRARALAQPQRHMSSHLGLVSGPGVNSQHYVS